MARILIIEDDDLVRSVLKERLSRAGHDVRESPNGRMGMSCLQSAAFDLVVTDIIMEEGDGIEAIRELRQRLPGVKIIAISGGGRIGPAVYLDLAEKCGAHRTFAKPFPMEGLLKAIGDLLGDETRKR
ncbi:MAG: response regulator [Planctomycetota bacterium]